MQKNSLCSNPEYAIAAKSRDALHKIEHAVLIDVTSVALGKDPTWKMEKVVIDVTKVGRRDENKILVVWTRAGLYLEEREMQVWVHPDYSGYKEGFRRAQIEAWEWAQSKKLTNTAKKLIIEPGYQIDHIFPKHWAKEFGYQWIRITDCPGPINNEWRHTMNIPKRPVPEIYYCDELLWKKWLMQPKNSIA